MHRRAATATPFLAAACVAVPAVLACGCGPTINPSFDSPEPAARNAAIVRAASSQDQRAVPPLVRMLDSDDPVTRMLAIDALERITGERLGYDHHAPQAERDAAAERWAARLRESP